MGNGTAVTYWSPLKVVVPYGLFDHGFFGRPDVGRDSVGAGGKHEAQNPRNLVRIDSAVNIYLRIDGIDQTRKVGRDGDKESDSGPPILYTRRMPQGQIIGENQIGEHTTPLVYR